MKYFFLIICVLSICVSCNKKKTIESVNTNNSKDSLTYQPKVPGSKWTYQRSLNGLPLQTLNNLTRLDFDTAINGHTYQVFNSDVDGRQYMRQDGNKYYLVIVAAANKTETMVIDVDKNVGDTWVGAVNGDETYNYTMVDKIPVYTLDGFTFKNVLKIHSERKDGNNQVTLAGDTWYAQGIGQVLSTGTIVGQALEIKLITVDLK
jgi:hypothetical protein